MLDEEVSGEFHGRNGLLSSHGWKVVEKSFQAVPGSEVVKQILYGHARAREHGCAAHDLGVNPDDGFERGHASVEPLCSMLQETRHGAQHLAKTAVCTPEKLWKTCENVSLISLRLLTVSRSTATAAASIAEVTAVAIAEARGSYLSHMALHIA
jgi:hypothetical protein